MLSAVEALLSTDTWVLKVVSWQEWVHAVNKSGSGSYPIGEHRIDLKCKMVRGLLQGDLLVGDDSMENLASLDFTIQLRDAQPMEDDENATGALVYYPPIPAKHSYDGRSSAGSVMGVAFFDKAALWEIGRSLSMLAEREIFLITTLRASATPNPGQLIYETQANRSTTYRWPGKHGLILYDVAFQNRAAEKKDEPEPEKPLAVQVSETIERAMGSLRSNITQIGICILILLGAILITLWHVR